MWSKQKSHSSLLLLICASLMKDSKLAHGIVIHTTTCKALFLQFLQRAEDYVLWNSSFFYTDLGYCFHLHCLLTDGYYYFSEYM